MQNAEKNRMFAKDAIVRKCNRYPRYFIVTSYWLSAQDTMEMTANQDAGLAGHGKKRKKTVSYCLSVPVEKSPLGKDRSFKNCNLLSK